MAGAQIRVDVSAFGPPGISVARGGLAEVTAAIAAQERWIARLAQQVRDAQTLIPKFQGMVTTSDLLRRALAEAPVALPRPRPAPSRPKWPKRNGRSYTFQPDGCESQAAFREAKRNGDWA